MTVTSVTIHKYNRRPHSTKYLASVQLDGTIAINGITLVEYPDATMRIHFPFLSQKRVGQDKPPYAVAPTTQAARHQMETAVCQAVQIYKVKKGL